VIVVDASAVVEYLVREPRNDALVERVVGDRSHAPHLLDVEVAHALRGFVLRGELTAIRASEALSDAAELTIERYPHVLLLRRAWELRDSLSTYDAVYVALAELLQAPLVTCDSRVANAHGHEAEVELFALDG
jgi:predicted nucleic acid-binding protein